MKILKNTIILKNNSKIICVSSLVLCFWKKTSIQNSFVQCTMKFYFGLQLQHHDTSRREQKLTMTLFIVSFVSLQNNVPVICDVSLCHADSLYVFFMARVSIPTARHRCDRFVLHKRFSKRHLVCYTENCQSLKEK